MTCNMKKIIALILVCLCCSCGCSSTNRDYTVVTASQLENDWKNDPTAAKEKYKGAYIEITETVLSYDRKGEYISIAGVRCNATNKQQEEFIKSISTGDVVIVKGKITEVKYREYVLDIHEISLDSSMYKRINIDLARESIESGRHSLNVEYAEITEEIFYIDEKNTFVSFDGIRCNITKKQHKKFLQSLSKHDLVTVRGKLGAVKTGEITLEVHDIFWASPEQVNLSQMKLKLKELTKYQATDQYGGMYIEVTEPVLSVDMQKCSISLSGIEFIFKYTNQANFLEGISSGDIITMQCKIIEIKQITYPTQIVVYVRNLNRQEGSELESSRQELSEIESSQSKYPIINSNSDAVEILHALATKHGYHIYSGDSGNGAHYTSVDLGLGRKLSYYDSGSLHYIETVPTNLGANAFIQISVDHGDFEIADVSLHISDKNTNAYSVGGATIDAEQSSATVERFRYRMNNLSLDANAMLAELNQNLNTVLHNFQAVMKDTFYLGFK